ncbi:MAG: hypothetical protein GC168_05025 [Candidatus Hydrogenedens sp.]|nr:hypothetical protein [Candidatus Hydrogenedens sp.]
MPPPPPPPPGPPPGPPPPGPPPGPPPCCAIAPAVPTANPATNANRIIICLMGPSSCSSRERWTVKNATRAVRFSEGFPNPVRCSRRHIDSFI